MGAMAASDGVVGATSDSDFDLRLTVAGKVRVWGFSDMSFATANGNETATQDICFYSTSERVSLKISSTDNNFRLGPNNRRYMAYTVEIKGVGTGDGVIPAGSNTGNSNTIVSWGDQNADNLSGETHASPFVAQNDDNTNCAGNENITVGIVFANAPNGGKKIPAGTHTDTVTLEVAPM